MHWSAIITIMMALQFNLIRDNEATIQFFSTSRASADFRGARCEVHLFASEQATPIYEGEVAPCPLVMEQLALFRFCEF